MNTAAPIWALVPAKCFGAAKSRLARVLDEAARAALARSMFEHVLATLAASTRVETTAVATFEKTDAGFTITKIHLRSVAQVPGASQEAFDAAANAAKVGCPISRVLRAEITLDAILEG